jgi:hypothetical protein
MHAHNKMMILLFSYYQDEILTDSQWGERYSTGNYRYHHP